jgi:hypothetical protein
VVDAATDVVAAADEVVSGVVVRACVVCAAVVGVVVPVVADGLLLGSPDRHPLACLRNKQPSSTVAVVNKYMLREENSGDDQQQPYNLSKPTE